MLESTETELLKSASTGLETQCLSASQPLLSESELVKSDESSISSTSFLSSLLKKLPIVETYQQ